MIKTLNKKFILSTICTLMMGTSLASSCDKKIYNEIHNDEITDLNNKRNSIVGKYTPNNLPRSIFKGFETEHIIEHNGNQFRIYDQESNREKTLAALPSSWAFLSNTFATLYLKSTEIDPQDNIQLVYGYKGSPLNLLGEKEYIITVEPILTNEDLKQFNSLTRDIKKIQESKHILIEDHQQLVTTITEKDRQLVTPITENDRQLVTTIINAEHLKIEKFGNPIFNKFIQRIQHAKFTIYNDAKIFDNDLPARLNLIESESTVLDKKSVIFNYQHNSREYCKFLIDSASRLSILSKNIHNMQDNGVEPLKLQPIKKLNNFMKYYEGISSQYKNHSRQILGMNQIQE